MMFGPPGTGKTLLASYAAQEMDTEFIEKDAAQIKSMWVGQSEQNVARLFNDARNKFQNLGSKKPIIIFIFKILKGIVKRAVTFTTTLIKISM